MHRGPHECCASDFRTPSRSPVCSPVSRSLARRSPPLRGGRVARVHDEMSPLGGDAPIGIRPGSKHPRSEARKVPRRRTPAHRPDAGATTAAPSRRAGDVARTARSTPMQKHMSFPPLHFSPGTPGTPGTAPLKPAWMLTFLILGTHREQPEVSGNTGNRIGNKQAKGTQKIRLMRASPQNQDPDARIAMAAAYR